MYLPKTFFSLLLVPLMATLPVCAQPASGSASSPAPRPGLQVRLADPGSAVVEASSSLKGYSILVTDASGAPVSGASVALRLPENGPGCFFVDGARSAVAYTDAAGVAKFAELHWNSILGVAQVRVNVSHNDQHLNAAIEQTVVDHADLAAAQTKAGPADIVPTDDSSNLARQPGMPVSVASVRSGATAGQSPAVQTAGQPATPDTIADTSKQPPSVSVVNQPQVTTTGGSRSGFNKKWLVVAAVAVGAAAGVAVALAGHGGAAAASSSSAGLTIGSPSITVGH